MSTDVQNILIGAGRFYTSPVGTTAPDENLNNLVWPGGWVEVGFTQGGIEFQYTPEVLDIEVDQELAPVKRILTGEELLVQVPVVEADLRNLKLAITASAFSQESAGSGITGKDILTFGSGTINEIQLGFEVESPESVADGTQGWRLALVWKAVSLGQVSHAYKKDEVTLIPIEFRAIVDSSKAKTERLARFVDWTAVST
ncbi:hypothetical protein LCGC14_0630220 [marine sediment metagenome]|uniref:Uncharacterized protein n=1 Tax=marine sediment metagenome TaxID=412755 RepID=A0A0F9UAM6_9ZZZZ